MKYSLTCDVSDDRDALVAEFRQVLDHPLVIEGLAKIRSKFRAVDQMGPVFVVAFEELDDRDERERVQRDAFERVNERWIILALRPSWIRHDFPSPSGILETSQEAHRVNRRSWKSA